MSDTPKLPDGSPNEPAPTPPPPAAPRRGAAEPRRTEHQGWAFAPPDATSFDHPAGEKPEQRSMPARRAVTPRSLEPPQKPRKPDSASPNQAEPPDSAKTAVIPAIPAARKPTGGKRPLVEVSMKKQRPAYTGFLMGVVYVILLLVASFVLGSTLWNYARDVLALQKEEITVTIEYTEDMTIAELAGLLKDEGIIEYEWLFKLYCGFSNAEEKIAPGRYNLVSLDYRAIIHMLNRNSEARDEVTVTLREGLTLDAMFDILEENRVCTRAELEEAAATVNFKYGYLQNLPAVPGRLEGYLFPDTYTFYVNHSPAKVIQMLVSTFNGKITADMLKQAEKSEYSLREIIIIASMIEMEAGGDMEERKNVASVIYNRLASDNFPHLQIDATLLYYMDGRREITAADKAADNPYNSYVYPGLPPGPICNPSLDSIRAALYPNKTSYYYYLLNDDDETVFCKTYEEHQQIQRANKRYD